MFGPLWEFVGVVGEFGLKGFDGLRVFVEEDLDHERQFRPRFWEEECSVQFRRLP